MNKTTTKITSINQGLSAKECYLLFYSIALKTLSRSTLNMFYTVKPCLCVTHKSYHYIKVINLTPSLF